jgi:hypothetical protein
MQIVDVAVNFDQVAAARVAMEAVNVLGQHTDLKLILPLRR